MEGLKLFIATVEGMQGASDGGVVVDEGMWLRTAPACRLPFEVPVGMERFMVSRGRARVQGASSQRLCGRCG